MYKDKDKQREVTKDRVRRYRDKQKGVTSEGKAEGVTLSDGQVWYPKQVMNDTGLPNHILRDIIVAVKTYGHVKGQPTFKERIRKALEYQEWAKRPKKLLEVTG